MNKPYIICHMMVSLDGRIDCDMTEQLRGTVNYYPTLQSIEAPKTLSGRVTAETELSHAGRFESQHSEPLGQEDFAKNSDAKGYEVIVDTKGVLLWEDDLNAKKPHLIITSEQVKKDYLAYLDQNHISWIATGKTKIDLNRAVEILADKFDVERMAIVGGGHINGSFLDAGLTDEISLVIGAGVDGRANMPAVFDGRPKGRKPVPLTLKNVQQLDNNAVWLRYSVQN
ncbi:dihydrofolate reductase family protein [Companilactobacillus alimentarius]